jgi:hypothetical protein
MSKLDQLEHEKKQLEEKIKRERSKINAERRKAETQKKILIASALMKGLDEGSFGLAIKKENNSWERSNLETLIKSTLSEKDQKRLIKISKLLEPAVI